MLKLEERLSKRIRYLGRQWIKRRLYYKSLRIYPVLNYLNSLIIQDMAITSIIIFVSRRLSPWEFSMLLVTARSTVTDLKDFLVMKKK
jgi:hypothetical protein